MGIDVVMFVEEVRKPELKAEELWIMDREFRKQTKFGDVDGRTGKILQYHDWDWLRAPIINVNTLARYYFPGGNRGNWPSIYAGIRALQRMYPGREVFYGGDSTDYEHIRPITEMMMAACWCAWLELEPRDGSHPRDIYYESELSGL